MAANEKIVTLEGLNALHQYGEASYIKITDIDKYKNVDVVRASTEITEDEVSEITIPFEMTEKTELTVYHNGILLTNDSHFTVSGNKITLAGYTAKFGDQFTFIGNDAVANMTQNGNADSILIKDEGSYYDSLTTVEGALQYAGANFPNKIESISVNGQPALADDQKNVDIDIPIKSISVNGVDSPPDDSGDVAITIPDIPVKSISVNGEDVPPDKSGKVDVTIPDAPVQSISMNGKDISPDEQGKVALENVMTTTTQQTMTAKVVAQSNTDYSTPQIHNIFFVAISNVDDLPDGKSGDICIIYDDSSSSGMDASPTSSSSSSTSSTSHQENVN